MKELLLHSDSDVKLVGTVHGEIILECPKGRAKEVSETLKAAMEDAGKKFRNYSVVERKFGLLPSNNPLTAP